MKKSVCGIAVSLILLLAGTGWAALDQEEKSKIATLAETLKLDAGQKAKLIKERQASRKALLRLEKKWQTLHDQLRREVRKDKPRREKVDHLTVAIGKLRGEIISLRTNSLLYLKSILKPEQKPIIEKGRPDKIPAEPKP
ncbi:hypothetical protein KAR10_06095 [bacterium]|nr:hypothetical protein [bacterium]